MSLYGQINKIPDKKIEGMKADAGKFNSASGAKWKGLSFEPLIFTNLTVLSGDWSADATYADYPFKADITCTGVTSSMMGDVVFHPAAVKAFDLAPVATTGTDTVTVYASAAPAASITVLQIKAVF